MTAGLDLSIKAGGNVVIKVLLSLFSHSAERVVKGGYLGLERWCNTGLTLTWDCGKPDQNQAFGKGKGTFKVWCCELPLSRGHAAPGSSRVTPGPKAWRGAAPSEGFGLSAWKNLSRGAELQLRVEVIGHNGSGWK